MFSQITTQIKAQGHFKHAEFALSIDTVQESHRGSLDQVFIVPMAESHSENLRDMGPELQEETITFGALVVLSVRNDPTGQKCEEKLNTARTSLRAALFGFKPTANHTRITLSGGELMAMDEGKVYWLDRFKTTTHKESNQ